MDYLESTTHCTNKLLRLQRFITCDFSILRLESVSFDTSSSRELTNMFADSSL